MTKSRDLDSKKARRNGWLAVVEPDAALFRYLEIAHSRDLPTLVLTSNAERCRAEEEDYNHTFIDVDASHIDRLVECDPGNPDAVLKAIHGTSLPVAGVVAGDDHFVPIVASVGRSLGFDYSEPADARAQQRKSDMKNRLAEAGVPTPAYVIATDFTSALSAWKRFDRDCVVKMVDFQGSLNVCRVETEGELRSAWDAIQDNTHGLDLPMPLAKEVLVEEYVPGRELTAEGYVDGDRVVLLNCCEKITAPNFVVIGHFMPADLSEEEAVAIRPVVESCVRALGTRNSVFHVELHLRDGVPHVIEAATRPPGQHMVDLMARSYEWDLMEIAIDLAINAPVDVVPCAPTTYYAIVAFYSDHTGRLLHVRGLDDLRARPDLLRLKLDLEPGDKVRALDTFHDRYGFAITEHRSAFEAREAERWIRDKVFLEVI